MRLRSRGGTLLALAATVGAVLPPRIYAQAAGTSRLEESTVERAASSISAADLRRRIGVLADDSMRGRDTPSPELTEAARYVAESFESFGLRPGLGDGYLQYYPVTAISGGNAASQMLRLRGPDSSLYLDAKDYVSVPVGPDVAGSGPLSLVDSVGALTHPDVVSGRVALIPASETTIGGVFSGLRDAVRSSGATGALVALDASPEFFGRVRAYFDGRQLSIGDPSPLDRAVMIVREDALPEPLQTAVSEGGPLPGGWSVEMRSTAQLRGERAMNVIGWIEGSDPELKNQYVLFTAHMDHVGVGRPVNGDSIYNGADDDASGTSTVIELAQAFAQLRPRPRRSIVFMTVSGEEKGLLGSRWYTEHPVFPLDETVAEINIDMVGRNWQDTIAAIGKDQSTLGATAVRVARAHPELRMTVVGDRWPEERFYYRSDHFNFAKNGVPILFFFNGTHEDYHQPSDEPSKIEYDKTARIARLLFYLGLKVADADEPPKWDPEAYRQIVGGEGR